MDNERNDQYEATRVQEKSREDLESYKELLKKELDSIRTLVSTDTTENNATKASNLTSGNVILLEEYDKLKEENRTLKFENESLNSTNLMLENDNKLLRENLERLNLENSNTTELEIEITRLKEVILNLEKEKLELRTKDTVEVSEEQESYDQNLPVDISNEIKSIFKSKESTETSASQVHTGYTIPPIKPKKFKRKAKPKSEKIIAEAPKSIPSEDSTSYSQQDSKKIIEETVRRKCPTCLNTNKKYIREFTDKSNIIMQYPRIYGKKFKCGICRTEWK
jgi:hypothetical protein